MHPRYEVERTYRARLRRPPTDTDIGRLRDGVQLEDGPTARARVRRVSPRVLEITIHEGRNRQVRRMAEAIGNDVVELERIAFGPLRLGELPRGQARQLKAAELRRLWKDSPLVDRPMSQPSLRDRVWAVRGAVVAAANDEASILEATSELMSEIMRRNDIGADHMVSVIFTATTDLDAAFPAAAARGLGLNHVPLLCAREIEVPNSMTRVIRVLLHYYAAAEELPEHVYLGEAQGLRADLHDAQ